MNVGLLRKKWNFHSDSLKFFATEPLPTEKQMDFLDQDFLRSTKRLQVVDQLLQPGASCQTAAKRPSTFSQQIHPTLLTFPTGSLSSWRERTL